MTACPVLAIASPGAAAAAPVCTALQCTPNDLLEVDTTPVEQPTPTGRPVVTEPPKAVGDGRRSTPPA